MPEHAIASRIALLRFLMIAGVVILHTPDYVPLSAIGDGYFDFIKAFFQHAVFRSTVPVLSCISGYLLFKADLDLQPQKLFAKKIRTLGIPLLVFNISLLVVAYYAQSLLHMSMSVDLASLQLKNWLDAAFGLTAAPVNYPLHFLRDLLMIAFIAPLLGMLVRRAPFMGLILVVFFFFGDFDGHLVLRGEMAVLFYIGGLAAVHQWKLSALDRYAPALLLAFISMCFAYIYFRIENTTLLRLLAPFLIWPAVAPLVQTSLGRWLAKMSKYSFFIFLSHAPVLIVSKLAYQSLPATLPYPVYWVAAPLLTIALLVGVHRVLAARYPNLFNFAIGARLPARAPRRWAEPGLALAAQKTQRV